MLPFLFLRYFFDCFLINVSSSSIVTNYADESLNPSLSSMKSSRLKSSCSNERLIYFISSHFLSRTCVIFAQSESSSFITYYFNSSIILFASSFWLSVYYFCLWLLWKSRSSFLSGISFSSCVSSFYTSSSSFILSFSDRCSSFTS